MSEIETRYRTAKDSGFNPKAFVLINPGNPTGDVVTKEKLEEIVKFCYENRLLLIADEVYQEITYEQPFVSARKVVESLGEPYKSGLEFVSIGSAAKGLLSECGLRGAYIELRNFDPFALGQFAKLRTVGLCPNVTGQLAVELMVNPPRRDSNSKEVCDLYEKEKNEILDNLITKRKLTNEKLANTYKMTCNPMFGSYYVFPRVHMTDSAIKEAKKRGMEPDSFYCVEMLKETGLMVVPGNGFRQKDGTYHFRMSSLVYKHDELASVLDNIDSFNKKFFAIYK